MERREETAPSLLRWAVAALGAVLTVLSLAHTFITPHEDVAHILELIVPLGSALILVAGGTWLVHGGYDSRSVLRVTGWSLVGLLALAPLGIWQAMLVTTAQARGVSASHFLLSTAAVGAVAGAVVGYYDVRRREEYERAERVRTAIETSDEGVAIFDRQERFTEVNPAYADLFGYEPSQLVGEGWQFIVPEGEAERLEATARPELERTGVWRGEIAGQRRDGETFPLEATVTQMDDGSLVAVVRDVSEERERERQLAALHDASREFTYAEGEDEVADVAVNIASEVLDRPLSAMWLYDEASDTLRPAAVTDSTRALLADAGFDELPDIEAGDLGMEVFRSRELRVVEDYSAVENPSLGGLGLGSAVLVPVGDHGLLELGERAPTGVSDAEQYQVRILARNAQTALDRTTREAELRERQRTVEQLHTATREMLQAPDQQTVCDVAVATTEETLDLPFACIWLASDDGDELVPTASTERARDLVGELPALSVDSTSEQPAVRAFRAGDVVVERDGATAAPELRTAVSLPLGEFGVLVIGSTTPDAFDEGDVGLMRLLSANTEAALDRSHRESELVRQTSQMEFFNSILRHDVLNGMTVIRGRGEMLAEELDGVQGQYAQTIVSWCDDITDIVGNVRTVLATLTGDADLTLRPVDLATVARAEVDRVATTYPEVEFTADLPGELWVSADDLLPEIVGNLVTNAVEHNEREGLHVSVSAERTDDRVQLRVADDGRGVPDELKAAIFRREETGHVKSSGSGFGLFFVDAMVEEYGGRVHVEDNEPTGAVFVVELDAARE